MGSSIVITSGKGGTGKTSLAGGIGSCLAALGHRVLCVDADVGLRNLDITLGMSDKVLFDFSDVIFGRAALAQAAAEHPKLKNLYMITAPVGIQAESIPLEDMAGFIKSACEEFDFCIVDSPAGLGYGFKLAAAGCDRAIVVATPDASSLRDSSRTAAELFDMGVGTVHLVVNRVLPKMIKRRDAANIDDAMDAAGLPLLGIVPEDKAVTVYANRGSALILREYKGAALKFLDISRRILGEKIPVI